MSGILKGIGKVFKKVVKVVKKVALPALMIGAVVLTGGAALGVLPALGTMVGGLGLSAGLTSVLTGAISTGALGAVGGFLTGGMKGATKGFLMGAATGGVLGGLGVTGVNGILGGGKAAASTATSAGSSGLVQSSGLAQAIGNPLPSVFQGAAGMAPAAGSVFSAAAPAAASILPSAAGVASAAVPAAAGGLGGMLSNPLLLSQLTGGIAQAFAPNEYKQRYSAEQEAAERAGYFTYGGGDPDGKKKKFGMIPGAYSGQANPFGVSTYGAPPPIQTPYQPRKTRWAWDAATNSVIEVGA